MNRYFADISNNNPTFNAGRYAAAGHVLVAIKASEGLRFVDPYHRGRALRAGGRHVAVVHYHFARPDQGNAPDLEALWFLHCCAGLLGPRDYVALDLERAVPAGWQHDPAWSLKFDRTISAHSRFETILYASRSRLAGGGQWLDGDDRRVWDADWSASPDYAPAGYQVAFRQYTDGQQGPPPRSFAGVGECDGSRMSPEIFRQVTRGL